MNEVALTPAAKAAKLVNDLHKDVVFYEKAAKDHAALVGEALIMVKKNVVKHGEFMPWVAAHCDFSQDRANKYIKVSKTKISSRAEFDRCTSIREVLALGKPKPAPKVERRAATLDDLRKVERLQALRDDEGAPVGEPVSFHHKIPSLRDTYRGSRVPPVVPPEIVDKPA